MKPYQFEPGAVPLLVSVPHDGQHVPEEIADDIKHKAIAQGLYAPNFPTELGGGGLDAVTMVLVDRELGRANLALQYCVARPSTALRAATGGQVEEYLEQGFEGALAASYALGAWNEAGRLAALSRNAEVLAGIWRRRRVAAGVTEIAPHVETLAKALDRPTPDFGSAEQAFSEIAWEMAGRG